MKASSAMASVLSGPHCVGDGGRRLAGLAGVAPCHSPGASGVHGNRSEGGLPQSSPSPGLANPLVRYFGSDPSQADQTETSHLLRDLSLAALPKVRVTDPT